MASGIRPAGAQLLHAGCTCIAAGLGGRCGGRASVGGLVRIQQVVDNALIRLSILCRVIGHAAKMARCLAEQGISNFLQVTLP